MLVRKRWRASVVSSASVGKKALYTTLTHHICHDTGVQMSLLAVNDSATWPEIVYWYCIIIMQQSDLAMPRQI